jgi:hypothetical protein
MHPPALCLLAAWRAIQVQGLRHLFFCPALETIDPTIRLSHGRRDDLGDGDVDRAIRAPCSADSSTCRSFG